MKKILQNKKIPKLRFPEFSGEWEEKRLEDITRINQGLQIPISERYTEKVENSYFYITNEFLKENSNKKYFIKNPPTSVLCEEEDLLMTRTGNTGQVVTGVQGAFHNNFFKIKYDKSRCDRLFLYYFLVLPRIQHLILRLAGISTIPDLNHNDFYKIRIFLPSLPEQQKIASFLSTVDERIGVLQKKREALEKYKKGIIQKIFPTKGRQVPEIRFKDDNGRDFPEWEEKRLGEIGEFLKGQGLSKNDIIDRGKNECVLYGELYTTYDEVINIVKSRTDSNSGTKSNKGDVLIPSSTTTSHIDLANATAILRDGVLLGGDINILRNTKGLFDSIFLAYYLTNHKRHDIARLAQGTTIIHLYHSHLKKLKIKIPSLSEQQKIANFLSAIDKKIEILDNKIKEMRKWKKGLMQRLFV